MTGSDVIVECSLAQGFHDSPCHVHFSSPSRWVTQCLFSCKCTVITRWAALTVLSMAIASLNSPLPNSSPSGSLLKHLAALDQHCMLGIWVLEKRQPQRPWPKSLEKTLIARVYAVDLEETFHERRWKGSSLEGSWLLSLPFLLFLFVSLVGLVFLKLTKAGRMKLNWENASFRWSVWPVGKSIKYFLDY